MALMLLTVAFAGIADAAEKGQDVWTRQLHMQYTNIRGTAVSPDGQLVAYVVHKAVMHNEKSEYLSHIRIVSSDGKTDVQYTRGEKSCHSPAFSPDGAYLAFVSSRSGKSQVWAMPVTGGEANRITSAESGVNSFKWSPDGKTIAYTMRDPETEQEKTNKKEKNDPVLIDKNFKYSHLYTIAFEGLEHSDAKAKQITSGEFSVSDFDWAPDSKSIVFCHYPDPTLNTWFISGDISIVPADSGKVTSLVEQPGVDRSPLFSPDGRYVAFVTNCGKPDPVGRLDICIVPAKGGDPVTLAHTPDRSPGILGWSSNSKQIYFTEFIKTNRCVLALPVNGDRPEYVTPRQGVFSNPSFNSGKTVMAFTCEEYEKPADVYISPVRKFKPFQLTEVNKDTPRPPMGKTELIQWTSVDGMEIEGLLTLPVGYEKGARCPLILQIHGGPAGVFAKNFTGGYGLYLTQYFAQHGYAILRPNPRGSTGYGSEFRHANVQDWGFGDYDDCMTGVDKVIDMGIAHTDSLLVMGWSYGGYMTSYIVTKTNRFKAASMGAGLPNLISMTTTTDIPDYLAAHMKGEYWDNYDVYEKHSAIYRIKNVKTPTQILHGQNDWRVPYTQGMEFYVSLKRLGVETEMIAYPRTPHSPREPRLLMDVPLRIMKWFEKHLRGRDFEETAPEKEKK